MQLHWVWAALGALALGAALAWWVQPANESADAAHGLRRTDAAHRAATHAESGPTLYRWVDAAGVVNVTDKPPSGRRYKIVHINPNQNIVPMSGGDSSSTRTGN